MREYVEFLVRAIVRNEDSVIINENLDMDNNMIITIEVNQEDMGLLIGKEGRTIKSIRNLVRSKAIKENKRVRVEVAGDKRNTSQETTEE